jgi:hypothetical protein
MRTDVKRREFWEWRDHTHHQRATAPVLTFIPELATFLLAPAGPLGLTTVPRTPTGMGFLGSLAPPFLQFGLSCRWRRFAVNLDHQYLAIVWWHGGWVHVGHAIFAHAEDKLLDRVT